FGVLFNSTISGSLDGTVSVVSNATNSPTIAASGTGMQTVSHSATLNWTPSASTVMGYYVYRGAQTGGPYAKLNAAPASLTTYTDSTVQAGQTYFLLRGYIPGFEQRRERLLRRNICHYSYSLIAA